jgi:hypothetical protein
MLLYEGMGRNKIEKDDKFLFHLTKIQKCFPFFEAKFAVAMDVEILKKRCCFNHLRGTNIDLIMYS